LRANNRRLATLDDRLPRRPKRRQRPRHRQPRQDGPPLPGRRPRRQARHREMLWLLARQSPTARHRTHLLGRLHVPERHAGNTANVEQHFEGDDRGSRGARVELTRGFGIGGWWLVVGGWWLVVGGW